MAAKKWTEEQRKQQSLKIRQWQPWQHSTGAKTTEGKAKSSRNALKGDVAMLPIEKTARNEISKQGLFTYRGIPNDLLQAKIKQIMVKRLIKEMKK